MDVKLKLSYILRGKEIRAAEMDNLAVEMDNLCNIRGIRTVNKREICDVKLSEKCMR